MRFLTAFGLSALLIVGSLVGSLYFVHGGDIFLIRRVVLQAEFADGTGDGRSAEESKGLLRHFEIRISQQLKEYQGLNLWLLRAREVVQRLRAEPYVQSVRVHKSWPGQLMVTVSLRHAEFLVLTQSGALLPVVSTGEMVYDVPMHALPRVPVVSDPMFFDDLSLRREVADFLFEIRSVPRFQGAKVSDLRYHPWRGFEAVLSVTGQTVLFGNEEFRQRAERVSQVLSYLDQRKLSGEIIDARFSQKVLVRLGVRQ